MREKIFFLNQYNFCTVGFYLVRWSLVEDPRRTGLGSSPSPLEMRKITKSEKSEKNYMWRTQIENWVWGEK